MKTLGFNPKKIIIALCAFIVGIFGLALLLVIFVYPIKGMKVYVVVPTNAPPWVLAAAATNKSIMQAATNNWTTEIPFNDATNKFVSETDVAQMKQVIPWNKTILHLYLPQQIVVESSTEAIARFSRQHIFLSVRLVKKNKSWHVENISSSTADLIGPPNWRERLAESLPR
jgi:hypothetical protein